MPTEFPAKKLLLLSTLLWAGAALAGCAGDDGLVKGPAEAIGMATTPQESKAFVRATRPDDMAFIPVGSTIPVAQLCPGPTPPPAYTPSGTSAHFATPKPIADPGEACKPRADFKGIEARLEAKQKTNEAAGNTAKALGAATTPPKPAQIPPAN
ncbi:MAG: hypothetical protein ACTHP8_13255 [Bosea sp. (in: a-proteobacteria)]|uniref:hypothetical protein n=1 Tax=unclassified Bosea (in: a-proteobacteria) TaxID=2653178 RepID=UPI000963D994|nr:MULTISPECIES: hypothetical protein [unclassified Bosea (in: a-proteobacteria)]MBN9443535.1 hypothetical protein [Bosea sp. (in: a-proteobacteria)]MBN9458437.1 hypothetical protein [Bosea sp. (in: a-proteobacteria)]OJV06858.1 MAG: hypothetical protein BGO20_00400 [Bosea sp. 67-29]